MERVDVRTMSQLQGELSSQQVHHRRGHLEECWFSYSNAKEDE